MTRILLLVRQKIALLRYGKCFSPCLFPPHRPKAPRLTDYLTALNPTNRR
jgi:hypothetical protein